MVVERFGWGLACCVAGVFALGRLGCAETSCEETRTCSGASTGGAGGSGASGGAGGSWGGSGGTAPSGGGTAGIPPVGSFGISVKEPSLTVVEPQSAELEVIVTRNQMNDPVTVELVGLPGAVTADPVIAQATDSSVKLTVSASQNAKHGTSTVTVRGTVGTDTKDVPLDLTVRGLPGTLDKSFGSSGAVTATPFGEWSHASSMAVASDGKIYVAGDGGSTTANTHAYFLMRFDASGQPDTGFGTNGVVARYTTPGTGQHVARGVIVDPQQRPLIVGYFTGNQLLAARFDDKGVLDPTFAGTGEVTGPGGNFFAATASGTKLVAAGKDDKTPFHALVARMGADGTPDFSFGSQSFASVDTATNTSEAVAVAVDADNKIVVAGNTNKAGAGVFAARFTPGGLADTFGTAGIAWLDPTNGGTATALAVRPDKRIVIGGGATGDKYFLFQLDAQGAKDASFGTGGLAVATGNRIDALTLDAAGRIVAGCRSADSVRIARFEQNGQPDSTFGTGGFADVTKFVETKAVLVLPDGRLLVVGSSSSAVWLARIWM